MVKKRSEGWRLITEKSLLEKIERGECPSCSKHKDNWDKGRRKDWRCCSVKCNDEFAPKYQIESQAELRADAIVRDDYTCAKCGKKKNTKSLDADHIIPISLGGDEWDINNIQTLCKRCHKIKTKQDFKKIAALRAQETAIKSVSSEA